MDEKVRFKAMTREKTCIIYRIDSAVYFVENYHYIMHQIYADGTGGRVIDTLKKSNRIMEFGPG